MKKFCTVCSAADQPTTGTNFQSVPAAAVGALRLLLPAVCCLVLGCKGDEEANRPAIGVGQPIAGVGVESTAAVNVAAQLAGAQESEVEPGYGDIAGQILFDGVPPEPELVIRKGDPNVKDAAVCAAKSLYDNSLLVDEKTKGIANVFVYIYHRNAKGMKIHPEAAKLKKKEIVFDQKNCRFTPHVMVVRTGQTVVVKSGDNCPHNTHTATIFNDEFNQILPPNDREGVKLTLNVPESLPMPVKCDIHPWMKAHWLIIDHPYTAITDKEGRFKIEKLPVGEIEFRIWHERVGYIDRAYTVNVKEGTTSLEPVRVPASMFE